MAVREPSPAERLSDSLAGGQTLPIGTVSAELGVTIDALRYYEAESLLGEVRRDSGGRRRYSSSNVLAIGVVHAMRRAGFSIEDVRGLVAVKRPGSGPAERVVAARNEVSRLERVLGERAAALAVARTLLEDFRAELDESGL